MKRRTWLLSALGVTGAMVVGWGVAPARSRLGSGDLMLPTQGDVALNGWIKITKEGAVVMAMPRSEMGQGVHTALAMLVAEELDVLPSAVRLEQAGADTIYGNVTMLIGSLPIHPLDMEPGMETSGAKAGKWIVGKIARELGINATGGSSSVADAWEPLRLAAATARASLLGAAAKQWNVAEHELTVNEGKVKHPSGKSAHFGEFARAAAGTAPQNVTLKDRKDWKVVGQPTARTDILAKTNGTAVFGIDVRLPNMLFASMHHAPMLGGTVQRMNKDKTLASPGVVKVLEVSALAGGTAGYAVVAKTFWQAKQAAQLMDVQWRQRSEGGFDTDNIQTRLTQVLNSETGFTFYDKGDASQAETNASRTVKASYFAPYLAHATMEPMNCTAKVADGKVEIWVPTQVPEMARAVAATVAGVNTDAVEVHVTLLGGGFGRRLDVDFVAQAVKVAMECEGKPVQLLWSREEDMTHDFYRPMHVAQMTASVDAQNNVQSIRIKSAGDAISPRWMERAIPMLSGPIDMPDKTASEGLFDLPYGFSNQHMSHVATRMGVPVGFWRSVGHSHNAFFSESFIDELAFETKKDPLAFRQALLKEAPRYLVVLNLAAEKAQWGKKMPVGHAQGIALHESFGSIVAEVVEVSVSNDKPRVHRVVCAIDCGTVVNPATVAQQMESAVVFGLTAALYGKIDIKDGIVQQNNFPSYPMLKLADAPQVETHIVASTNPPGGVGEPGVPPLAPAVASALFALTGKRQRVLPLTI